LTVNADVIGTREDPHAQIRAARRQPLLLHSMSVFRELFEIVFASREISTVVEVGVESGQVSSVYTELGAKTVYCVDPTPTDALRATLDGKPGLQLVERPSPAVLAELPVADLYVLDGDHNYAVVHAELTWILANAPDATVLMHDVLWPWSRRDLYYQPCQLTADQQHESTDDGPTVWHDEVTPAGFVGLGAFTVAREAGNERNGVLTAVEDVLAQPENADWRFDLVPAVFGMGFIVRVGSEGADRIVSGLRPYSTSKLLLTMENNRIASYTRILQMQYEAVAHADEQDRLVEQVGAQRREIDRLRSELEIASDQRDEYLVLKRDNLRLRELLSRRFGPRLAAQLYRLGKAAEPQIRRALSR
jgi:hypothetical protein